MKYTDQIRKHFGMAAAAALTACMLFGCTRADVGSTSQNLSNTNGGGGQSTVNAGTTASDKENTLAGAGSGTAQNVQGQNVQGQNVQGQNAQGQNVQGQNVQGQSGTAAQQTAGTAAAGTSSAAQTGQSTAPAGGQSAQDVSGTTAQAVSPTAAGNAPASAGTPASQDQSASQAPSASQPQNPGGGAPVTEGISGEFQMNDGMESVVITIVNDSQISFQFLESGISALAQAGGSTAVYQGDDGYSITFDIAGDTLAVSVSGEGGEESPMNGIYYRVLDEGEGTGEEAQADDGGEDEIYNADDDAE